MRTPLVLVALAAIAAAIALAQAHDESQRAPASGAAPTRPQRATPTPAPVRTPAPPRLSRAQINRQDRAGAARRAIEARVFDARPLLQRLPLARGGVRIDIAGLAPDDRSTVLSIDPGQRSRAHARRVYRSALRQTDDDGTAYVLEWAR